MSSLSFLIVGSVFTEMDGISCTFSQKYSASPRQRGLGSFSPYFPSSRENATLNTHAPVLCFYSLVSFFFTKDSIPSDVCLHLPSDSSLGFQSNLCSVCNSNIPTEHFSFIGEVAGQPALIEHLLYSRHMHWFFTMTLCFLLPDFYRL